jgi:hypothetical protein
MVITEVTQISDGSAPVSHCATMTTDEPLPVEVHAELLPAENETPTLVTLADTQWSVSLWSCKTVEWDFQGQRT